MSIYNSKDRNFLSNPNESIFEKYKDIKFARKSTELVVRYCGMSKREFIKKMELGGASTIIDDKKIMSISNYRKIMGDELDRVVTASFFEKVRFSKHKL